MEKQFNNRITQRLQDITRKGREQVWTLTGIDGDAIQNIAQDVNQELISLSDNVRRQIASFSSAQVIARQQDNSLKYIQRLSELEVQGVIPVGSIDSVVAPSPCLCGIAMLADSTGHNEPQAETTGNAQGSIIWDPPEDSCSGHPIVDAIGNGNLSAAQLESLCSFTFTPSSTDLYCIRPDVQLNGYYLAWTWGSCEQEPSRSSVQVQIVVTVEQPAANLERTRTITVLNESSSFPTANNVQSGFAYNSIQQGGAGVNAVLLGGTPVTVRIACILDARVENLGRALVDLQTSPQFYVRVPAMRWGAKL